VFGILVLTLVVIIIFNLSWCAPIRSLWDVTAAGIFCHSSYII